MKSTLKFFAAIASSAVLLSAGSALATVTLQFSQTSVARATGFADHLGTPTNGMAWGIIVDSTGNGFSAGTYDVFSSGTTSGSGIQLSAASVATDDFYVSNGLLTSTQTATGTDPGGVGGITSLANIFSTYPSGVNVGDAFRIVWFETTPANGSYYGMMSDPSFVLPADGNITSFASVFSGGTADPAKAATFQFGGGAVPEPSRALLAGLGLFGLMIRRRRK